MEKKRKADDTGTAGTVLSFFKRKETGSVLQSVKAVENENDHCSIKDKQFVAKFLSSEASGHSDGGPLNINDNEDFIAYEGNFRALLRLRLDSEDQDLKKHLLKAGKNATYISSVSQNEIISSCNDMLLSKIVAKVNKAKCFSILADETTHIPYFLQFVPIFDMSSKGISEVIIGKLREFGIDTDNLYGQGYDCASAMSGAFSGVRALVRKKVPNALYVHCSSHSLSLALSDSC
ncbi:hypothetical protein RN001_012827 [Aquatica leii]|uniref:DUF4371 domain-containing protein n=1 Tax=Aquatica leii TaxID=1421715 RepID=A0AAN7SPN4_9COLE|nr:hypothetical protein RN001_012827 [Aquatica leii]